MRERIFYLYQSLTHLKQYETYKYSFSVLPFGHDGVEFVHVVADTKTHGLSIPFAGSITFGHMRYILQKKSKLNGAKQERIQMLKKAEEEENEKRRMFFNKNLEPHSILRDFSAGRF